jgi:glycosyltransferase involved in cell wall biosynthesis
VGGLRVLQVLGDTDDREPSRAALDLHGTLSGGAELRTIALGPGRRGGLDAVVPVLAPSRASFAARTQLRREARWADVVVLHGGSAAVAARALDQRGPPAVVALGEEPWGWSIAAPARRLRSALARRVVVVTDPGAAERVRAAGVEPSRLSAIPWAAPPAGAVSPDARRAARVELGLEDSGAVARWVGDPGEPDGLEVAVEAAGAAGVRLLTADAARDPAHAELVEAAADVAVLPTRRHAGPPRGLLAAARAGCALVAPRHGALGDLVDERTGAPAGTGVEEVAAALAALAADASRRGAAGAAAAERVAVRFEPVVVGGAWLELLGDLAAPGAGP